MAYFFCLSGQPGVGKSTIAAELARQTGALWLRVDVIEAAMRGSDHAPHDLADLGYRALCGAAEGALAQGLDVIGDSVNPIAYTRRLYRDWSAQAGATHIDILLRCSDQAEHRARVETRGPTLRGQVLPDWAAVMSRDWEPFADAHLTLDTAQMPPQAATEAIMAYMETRNG